MCVKTSNQLKMLKQELVREFFKHDIIKMNTNEYFTLSSGIKFPVYLDHRLIFSFPKLRKKVLQSWTILLEKALSEQVTSWKGNTRIVFSGTATAGIAPAYGLSTLSDTGFIYVRSKSKEYGLTSQIEGSCSPDSRFIVIDDMVVTGGSILKNARVLQNLYGKESILCVSSISCHESGKMRHMFQEHSLRYTSLFTTLEMFQIALEQDVISQGTFDIIIKFLKVFDQNPE